MVETRTAGKVAEHPGRLRTPMRRVGDRHVKVSWDEAIRDIAATVDRIVERA
jgi:formate dehydrogenase